MSERRPYDHEGVDIVRILRIQQNALTAIARRLDRIEELITSNGEKRVTPAELIDEAEARREVAEATREQTAAQVEAEVYGGSS